MHKTNLWLVEGALIGLLCFIGFSSARAGDVFKDVPEVIGPGEKYLFYMHGLALERKGRGWESYNYSGILTELARRGFVVIGEERSPVRNEVYAEKVAAQVKKLLAAGVPARNITVAGHSKGGMTAMLVMATLAEPNIAYVNFAGCGLEGSGFAGLPRFAERQAPRARGRLLSAYDRNDRVAGSCKQALEKMTDSIVKERVLDNGGGHEMFYSPEADWLDVLQAWAERRDQ